MNRRGLPFVILALLLLTAGLVLSACPGSKTDGETAPAAIPGGDTPIGPLIPMPIDPAPSEYLRLSSGDAGFNEFPAEFSDFALYWVGEEFGGHVLRDIIRQIFSPEDGSPTGNSVSFIYGSCIIEPNADGMIDGGCAPPLQIIVQPYCLVPPELVGNGTRPASMEEVRGDAEALRSRGSVRIWTGDVTVKISAWPSQLLEDATAALVSPNGLGVTSAGAPLPAPDPDCSEYRMVPLHQG